MRLKNLLVASCFIATCCTALADPLPDEFRHLSKQNYSTRCAQALLHSARSIRDARAQKAEGPQHMLTLLLLEQIWRNRAAHAAAEDGATPRAQVSVRQGPASQEVMDFCTGSAIDLFTELPDAKKEKLRAGAKLRLRQLQETRRQER